MERVEEIRNRLGETQYELLELGEDDSRRPSSELILELKRLQKELLRDQNIDDGTGRAKVERRITHLESVLKERGHL